MLNAWFPNWSYPIAEALQHLSFGGGCQLTLKRKGRPNKIIEINNRQMLQMYNIAVDPKNHDLGYGQFMNIFQDKLNLDDWDIIVLDAYIREEIDYCSKNKNNPNYFFESIKNGTVKSRQRTIYLLGKWWEGKTFEFPDLS